MAERTLEPRILEKQNSLQIESYFFPFPHISQSVVLLFKDSTSGTREPKGAEFQDQFYTRARIKPKRDMAIGSGICPDFNFYKFRSRKSEAASAHRRCSQPDLDTPKPRRSEARPR